MRRLCDQIAAADVEINDARLEREEKRLEGTNDEKILQRKTVHTYTYIHTYRNRQIDMQMQICIHKRIP